MAWVVEFDRAVGFWQPQRDIVPAQDRGELVELPTLEGDDRIPLAVARMLWAGSAGLSATASGAVLNRLAAFSMLSGA